MQYLYRHFSEEGELLYVGVSLSPVHRLVGHRKGSHWFGLIRRVEIEEFATREEALKAETVAIISEQPLHNIQKRKVKEIKVPKSRELEPGTRVKVLVQTFSGWKGEGFVVDHHGNGVTILKDGYGFDAEDAKTYFDKDDTEGKLWNAEAELMRHEVRVLK